VTGHDLCIVYMADAMLAVSAQADIQAGAAHCEYTVADVSHTHWSLQHTTA